MAKMKLQVARWGNSLEVRLPMERIRMAGLGKAIATYIFYELINETSSGNNSGTLKSKK
jgi:antitoxin component of MazEF toxin-antitoxin module